ncbi:hypothetical protein HPB48_021530 [Haemaphysalis longicornis]|uniref:Organic cation transporter protein-like n=1 Tax=Haemaphysalis longicornis TaxID=44386 RepID=A0A9J6FNL4_HAELO|nr:hypothetical protein HPB48_021530 [Haemaphysalis longicornis]
MYFTFHSFVHESPRWLITTGKEGRAEDVIAKILRMNRMTVPDCNSTVRNLVRKIQESSATAIGPLEILKHSAIKKHTIMLFVLWFCDNLLMYTFVIGSAYIKGSHLVNFAVSTAAEMPASFLGLALVYYCRRRPSQVSTLLLAAAVAVAAQLTPPAFSYVGLSLSMVGRFVLILSACVKWVWTMELYPTAARGFGFAACFTIGRIGGIVAPFMTLLNKYAPGYAAAVLLGAAGILGATMAALLPETRGVELPDTFEDAEEIARKPAR